MGFATQCITLFFCGFFGALIYARKLRKKTHAWSGYLWMICNFGMWIWGILLYLNLIPIGTFVNWIPWVEVADGREWMWNSFQLLGVDFGLIYTPGLDHIAVILFLSYPMWYLMGADGGRMFWGRRTYEEGYWWGLAPLRKPKNR
jgi:hypothetical protein